MRLAYALLAFSAVVIAAPLSSHGLRAVSRLLGDEAGVPSGAEDDDLMVPEDGPVVRLPNYSPRGNGAAWLKFKMDECGLLQRVENEHSTLRQSAFVDDLDGTDDDDPSVRGEDMIRKWLSEHAELAVVNDGVDSWCSDGTFDDEDDVPNILASWTASHRGPGERGSIV